MEENKYEEALERAKSAIKECGNNLGRIKMIESIFPELGGNEDERIRKAIISHMHIVKSVNGVDVSEILAWLEKVKDFDKQLEEAYKTADEVQYNMGYQDAMDEKEKFVDVILDFPTNFEREVSHFAASILNKEYDYTSAFIKFSAKGLLESAKLELEKQGNSDDKVKPKFHWKPSNEQITWLYRAADDASKDSRMKQVLNELLSDLKKLSEK